MKNNIYDHKQVEEKWLKLWEDQPAEQQGSDKEKLYLLFAFPYPSGSGLHVGHVESKTALDILARYHRMNGKDVFFPIGWDAFGLPAENYAIKTGVHPSETTSSAINTFKRQIKRIGISYDWEREIAASHPGYYKWTQWLFLQLHKKGLAYQAMGTVNWCPSCQTVLANEQVVDGHCERCDTEVVQKEMKQWYFKITDYKDQLIDDLDQVDWPEPTKQQQKNWVGRSEGVEIKFELVTSVRSAHGRTLGDRGESKQFVECFTTRIDTIFGVTYLVISPEKFVEARYGVSQENKNSASVKKYIDQAFKKTEEERRIGERDKTGVDTELKAINPVNGEEIPVFVADYVLGGYGTGAVMGVPAHDKRDMAFAKKHDLKIKKVIEGNQIANEDDCYPGYGKLVNSDKYDGMMSEEAQKAIVLDHKSIMKKVTTYKLRDWLISRQRYWGAPIPIVYDPDGKAHPVKEEHLPWKLPDDVDFKPTGESPLRSSKELLERTEKLYGKGWTPEYDTMDTFVCSSWYYLRFADPRNEEEFVSKENLKKWMPVDFYMIGPEHIVLHLLYSRFFTKFLRDEGYLDFDEPFLKMRHQGMILGPDGKKMSKSKGNVISPDDIVEKFGADTLRIYEMFMGPIEADKPWDINAVSGIHRFLNRIYRLVNNAGDAKNVGIAYMRSVQIERKLHQTIKKVSQDIPKLKFNTAIASMMEFINLWEIEMKNSKLKMSNDDIFNFIKLLAPFAPFLAEELNAIVEARYSVSQKNQNKISIHSQDWPEWDENLAREEEMQIPVQVNGKLRDQVIVKLDEKDRKAEILERAKNLKKVQKWIEGKEVVKEICVPGKIINFVVK